MALTDIIGKLGGQQDAVTAIARLFGGTGVQGIVSAMHKNGLSQQAKSWVANGKNQPITAADVKKMANPQLLAEVAKQHDLTPDALCEHIAQALPNLVDKATPNGQVPKQASAADAAKKQGSATDALAGMLKKK